MISSSSLGFAREKTLDGYVSRDDGNDDNTIMMLMLILMMSMTMLMMMLTLREGRGIRDHYTRLSSNISSAI